MNDDLLTEFNFKTRIFQRKYINSNESSISEDDYLKFANSMKNQSEGIRNSNKRKNKNKPTLTFDILDKLHYKENYQKPTENLTSPSASIFIVNYFSQYNYECKEVLKNSGEDDKIGLLIRAEKRFRNALSFSGYKTQEPEIYTQIGYDILMKLFLIWGSFESVMNIIGKNETQFFKNSKTELELGSFHFNKVKKIKELSSLYDKKCFFENLVNFINTRHKQDFSKKELEVFFTSLQNANSTEEIESVNLKLIIYAIRNSIAHSNFTPNSGLLGTERNHLFQALLLYMELVDYISVLTDKALYDCSKDLFGKIKIGYSLKQK